MNFHHAISTTRQTATAAGIVISAMCCTCHFGDVARASAIKGRRGKSRAIAKHLALDAVGAGCTKKTLKTLKLEHQCKRLMNEDSQLD